MKPQIAALRVKIGTLADEARLIRREERRAKGRRKRDKDGKVIPGEFKYRDDALYLSLRSHRLTDVRKEQRAALLAYAFIRNVPYLKVEPRVDWKRHGWSASTLKKELTERVRALVKKFGDPDAFRALGDSDTSRTAALWDVLVAWEQQKAETVVVTATAQ